MIDEFNFAEFTVLIVDDSHVTLGVLSDYLSDYDFKIITAHNGEDGLNKAEQIQPQLILLDVMMPDIDGFEVCRRLKSNSLTKHIPIILMTIDVVANSKYIAFEAGAVDYVTHKPLYQREILARVIPHLQIQALRQQLRNKERDLQS